MKESRALHGLLIITIGVSLCGASTTRTELLRRTSGDGDLLHPSCLKRVLPGLQQRSHDGWNKATHSARFSKEHLGIGAYESKKTPPCVWVLPGAIRLTVWEVTAPYVWVFVLLSQRGPGNGACQT